MRLGFLPDPSKPQSIGIGRKSIGVRPPKNELPQGSKPWGSCLSINRDGGIRTRDPLNPIRSPGWPISGKNTSKSLVGRTICRSCSDSMPDSAGLKRPNNRPNRHTNRPRDADPATSGLQSLAQGGPFAIRFRCSLLTRLTRTPPALSARTSLSGSRTPSPRPSTHQEDPSGGRGRPTKRDAVPAGYTLLESGRRC